MTLEIDKNEVNTIKIKSLLPSELKVLTYRRIFLPEKTQKTPLRSTRNRLDKFQLLTVFFMLLHKMNKHSQT